MRGSGGSVRRPVGAVYDCDVLFLFCYSCLSFVVMYLFVFEYSLHCIKYVSLNVKPLNIYIKPICSCEAARLGITCSSQ